MYGPPGWPGVLSVGRASSASAASRSSPARAAERPNTEARAGRQLAAARDAVAARELGRLAQGALGAGDVRAQPRGPVGCRLRRRGREQPREEHARGHGEPSQERGGDEIHGRAMVSGATPVAIRGTPLRRSGIRPRWCGRHPGPGRPVHCTVARMRVLPLALLLVLAAAAPAAADSLVYVKDSNVWSARPDGSEQRRLTTDGTPQDPYSSPSQADDGTIVAVRGTRFHKLDAAGPPGSARLNSLLTDKPGSIGAVGPFDARISPDGRTDRVVAGDHGRLVRLRHEHVLQRPAVGGRVPGRRRRPPRRLDDVLRGALLDRRLRARAAVGLDERRRAAGLSGRGGRGPQPHDRVVPRLRHPGRRHLVPARRG